MPKRNNKGWKSDPLSGLGLNLPAGSPPPKPEPPPRTEREQAMAALEDRLTVFLSGLEQNMLEKYASSHDGTYYHVRNFECDAALVLPEWDGATLRYDIWRGNHTKHWYHQVRLVSIPQPGEAFKIADTGLCLLQDIYEGKKVKQKADGFEMLAHMLVTQIDAYHRSFENG